MLTEEQYEEFEQTGLVVVPSFLSADAVQQLKQVIDDLHAGTPYDDTGRWNLRNCLPHHSCFIDLSVNKELLAMMVQLLSFNIKLLGSQIVKMKERSQAESLSVNWHRDGGALSAELPDPLPPLFVKAAFCISGSPEPDAGELLVAPGTSRLIGDPVSDPKTGWPLGFTRVLVMPGDLFIFDWRTWHAVNRNLSDVVRRIMYLAFGFRWLAPIDYRTMPEKLLNISAMHRQVLGGATELGSYLPSNREVPLKVFA